MVACRELDDKAVAKLLTPKELLRLALELSVWRTDLYGIGLKFRLEDVAKKVSKSDVLKITSAYFEEVLALPGNDTPTVAASSTENLVSATRSSDRCCDSS